MKDPFKALGWIAVVMSLAVLIFWTFIVYLLFKLIMWVITK
jgi:hypothetical protein